MEVIRKVLGRKGVYYLRKKNAKPKSSTIQKLAEELGIYLPSPQEIIEKLREKGIAYAKMSKDIFGNINHTSSFFNAYKKKHSLRFETYQKLLDYAYQQGILSEKVNLEEILKKSGL